MFDHVMKLAQIRRLAQRDVKVGQSLTFRYCALCNSGDEEYAEIYAQEYRKLLEGTLV